MTTGTLTELRRHTRTTVHAVTLGTPAGLADAPGVAQYSCERLEGQVEIRFTTDAEHLDSVVGGLHAAGIHTLTVTPPSLDALFLRTYHGQAGTLGAEHGEPEGATSPSSGLASSWPGGSSTCPRRRTPVTPRWAPSRRCRSSSWGPLRPPSVRPRRLASDDEECRRVEPVRCRPRSPAGAFKVPRPSRHD